MRGNERQREERNSKKQRATERSTKNGLVSRIYFRPVGLPTSQPWLLPIHVRRVGSPPRRTLWRNVLRLISCTLAKCPPRETQAASASSHVRGTASTAYSNSPLGNQAGASTVQSAANEVGDGDRAIGRAGTSRSLSLSLASGKDQSMARVRCHCLFSYISVFP